MMTCDMHGSAAAGSLQLNKREALSEMPGAVLGRLQSHAVPLHAGVGVQAEAAACLADRRRFPWCNIWASGAAARCPWPEIASMDVGHLYADSSLGGH